MGKISAIIKNFSKIQILALVLIIGGLTVMVSKGLGMLDFYKEVQYARENNFQAGNPSPDLLRPWMSIRYISVAYAVPQKYLFEAAGIQPKKESSMVGLNRLNNMIGLGQRNGRPALLDIIRQAIIQYRENPVVTGLIEQHVADWMTIQYISNSTGIPVEKFFGELGIPQDGRANFPLGYLSDVVNYVGGPKELVAAIQKIVDANVVNP